MGVISNKIDQKTTVNMFNLHQSWAPLNGSQWDFALFWNQPQTTKQGTHLLQPGSAKVPCYSLWFRLQDFKAKPQKMTPKVTVVYI